jgi:hypothetical protein
LIEGNDERCVTHIRCLEQLRHELGDIRIRLRAALLQPKQALWAFFRAVHHECGFEIVKTHAQRAGTPQCRCALALVKFAPGHVESGEVGSTLTGSSLDKLQTELMAETVSLKNIDDENIRDALLALARTAMIEGGIIFCNRRLAAPSLPTLTVP